ncbi:MAG TPA: hypothetical protein VFQ84_05170 [Arenimonas sp.]|uniref:hypothetical protein n=1 Tax=Arenimonas sp. TaxID=1872635 RepID=UPI002D7E998F|nr:hypothetical protein [Arenimonas sp.]HEU0152719.1 hypothetical protein [Arenimonas sp.]
MIEVAALGVIVLAATYLLALGTLALILPARVRTFLLAHASTPFLHGLELALRLLVGVALLARAPSLPWPPVFARAGWLLVLTTGVLALVPWRWHQRFASRTVPVALRALPLIGISAALMGAGLLYAALFWRT